MKVSCKKRLRLYASNLRTPLTGGAEAHNGGSDGKRSGALETVWEENFEVLRRRLRRKLGRYVLIFVSEVFGFTEDFTLFDIVMTLKGGLAVIRRTNVCISGL